MHVVFLWLCAFIPIGVILEWQRRTWIASFVNCSKNLACNACIPKFGRVGQLWLSTSPSVQSGKPRYNCPFSPQAAGSSSAYDTVRSITPYTAASLEFLTAVLMLAGNVTILVPFPSDIPCLNAPHPKFPTSWIGPSVYGAHWNTKPMERAG